MNQGRKYSSYESSARIGFYSVVAAILISLVMILFPHCAEAQTDKWLGGDKFSHVTLSSAGTILFTGFYANYPKIKNPAFYGACTMFTVGLGKEFVYDKIRGGKPSYKDLTANLVGCAVTYGLIKLMDKPKRKNRK